MKIGKWAELGKWTTQTIKVRKGMFSCWKDGRSYIASIDWDITETVGRGQTLGRALDSLERKLAKEGNQR